jgi:hypothetical protein
MPTGGPAATSAEATALAASFDAPIGWVVKALLPGKERAASCVPPRTAGGLSARRSSRCTVGGLGYLDRLSEAENWWLIDDDAPMPSFDKADFDIRRIALTDPTELALFLALDSLTNDLDESLALHLGQKLAARGRRYDNHLYVGRWQGKDGACGSVGLVEGVGFLAEGGVPRSWSA